MNDWQTGTPPAPGLYLTIEMYEYAEIGLRVFGHNHQWGGSRERTQPVMWVPVPTPPGYQPLQVDPYMLEKAA